MELSPISEDEERFVQILTSNGMMSMEKTSLFQELSFDLQRTESAPFNPLPDLFQTARTVPAAPQLFAAPQSGRAD